MNTHKKSALLIIYLGALAAFAPFTVDSYLPAMPGLVKLFHTTAANIQLTLSLFLAGFAIGLLFWGPLSDRVGRKAVTVTGIFIFVCGSLFCGFSHSVTQLIFARIIQAFGACAGIVMSLTIIKDTFTDAKEMTKVMSSMISVAMISPMIAPIIGSYLLVHFGWSSIFYFLAAYGFILIIASFFTTESYPKSTRKPLPVNRLFHSYYQQAKFTPFLLITIAVATNFSVMFSFIASSPFIYIKLYELPRHLFGYFFAINAAAVMLGTITLRRLKGSVNDVKLITIGLLITIVGAILMLVALKFNPTSIWNVVIFSFIVTYGVGILYPELTSTALRNVVQYTGLASSLINTSRSILSAIVGLLMGAFIVDSALPLGITMLILSLLTATFFIIYLLSIDN